MRDNLFRGRKKGSTEWAYGYIAAYDLISPRYPEEVSNELFVKVDPSTVGQYIGKNDRNKNRLFDGDIIRFKRWKRGDFCWVGVILFDYCSFIVKGGPNKELKSPFEIQMSGIEDTWCERIGNIYDNPELLDGGKNGK